MEELTLTGATMLADGNKNNSMSAACNNNEQHSHVHSHSHTHSHAHHQQQQHKASCPHHGGHGMMMVPQTALLALKQPAAELVRESNDEQIYSYVLQIVRMGTYEMLLELIQAWKDHREHEQQAEDSNDNMQKKPKSIDDILVDYDEHGHTLLHWSSKRTDNVNFVQYFLELPSPSSSNASNPTRDETQMTCLHWACTQEYSIPIIREILKSTEKQHPDQKSILEIVDATGCTCLLIAAQHGHVETAAYLIQHGANIYSVDKNKDSAIHWACYKGSENILGLLLYYDTNKSQLLTADNYGQTPIHLASLRGHVSVVRYLLTFLDKRQTRDLLKWKDNNGRTPYELAKHKNKMAVAAVLEHAEYRVSHRAQQRVWQNIQNMEFWKSACTIRTCKVWLGLPEVDDVDESPKLPFYYVLLQIGLHVIIQFTMFVPIFNVANGILWDYMMTNIIQIVLVILTMYTLYKIKYTHPGRPDPNVWRRLYEHTLEHYFDDHEQQPSQRKIQLCHTCHMARPPRSKHDRFTRSCILMFDHRCPFVDSSIGLYNYKWFYAFLLLLTIYLCNFWYLLFLYYHRQTTPISQHMGTLVLCLFLGGHILFPLGMLIYHTQLVAKNLSTNEHLNLHKYWYFWQNGSNFANPWDRGLVQNFVHRLLSPGDHCYRLPDEQERLLPSSSPQQHTMETELVSPAFSSDTV